MATHRYFSDINGATTELKMVYQDRDFSMWGTPVDFTPYWDAAAGKHVRGEVRATRVIQMKARPSRHECDARCLNATGRIMKCECACGGKNHGRGAFVCGAA